MRGRPQALFSLAIMAFAIWALASTQGWQIRTALYPRVIGVPLLILAAVELVLSLRGAKEPEERAMDVALAQDIEPKVALRRTLAISAWILGFFFAVLVLGFPYAIPLFVFAHLKGQKEGWGVSVVLAGLAWLLFYGLFIRVLHLPFPDGLLFHVLN